jgi:O-antigen ligase
MSNHESAMVFAAPVVALVTGVAVAYRPLETVGTLLALVLLPMLVGRPSSRLIAVLFGGLLVLQSSSGLSPIKVGYLAVVVLSSGIAMGRLSRKSDPWLLPFRRLSLTCALTVSAVVISLPVAHGSGITTTAWFRDVVPYLMLALVLPVALDAGCSASTRTLQRVFVASGLLAAIGFSLDWLDRRGVSALSVGKVTLSTLALVAAPFCYGLLQASVTRGRARLYWFGFCTSVFAAILVTGTRTGMILFAAFVGLGGVASKARIPLPRLGRLLAPLALTVAVAVPLLGSVAIKDPTFLNSRVTAAVNLVSGSDQTADQSYLSRQYQYREAVAVIRNHPFFGAGPGYVFESGSSVAASTTTIDSPLGVVAKFGLTGTALLAGALGVFASAFRRARLDIGPDIALTAARGFFVVFLAELPFGGFMEDKGLALTLMSMTALSVARMRDLTSKAPNGVAGAPKQRRTGDEALESRLEVLQFA